MKQAILIRQDLNLPKGKLASQCSHAAVECTLKSDKNKVKDWHNQGMAKIVLKVKDLKELMKFKELAGKNDLKVALIKDAGLTEFEKPEITCLGIGPDKEEKIDKITGKLKIL